MAKNEEAESIASVLSRVLTPLIERIERLEGKQQPDAPQLDADERFHAMMRGMRGQDQKNAAMLVEVIEGCISDTGSTFDAEIMWPPVRDEMGHIVGRDEKRVKVRNLLNYKWPEGIDKHTVDGGLVPEGMEMKEISGNWIGQPTDAYRQWVYDEFTKRDFRHYVGKHPSLLRRIPAAQVAKTG